jgi:hypothetical protein
MRRFGSRKWLGVLLVVATATVGLPQLVAPDAGAVPGVVPPVIGNSTIGLSTAPPEIQAFEAAAVEKIRQSYNLPPGDATAVQAWARDEVAALEWLEIVRIINEPPAVRAASAQDTAVYNWMAGLVKARRVAEAQGAIDEFQRWSGLSEWDMVQPVPPDPDLGLYCSYQPPGGSTGPYKGTYSTQYDQNCSTHGCTNWVGCNLAYPTVKQFSAWGAYAAAMEDDFVTPAFLDRAAGVAKTISVAAAVALGGAAAPLEVILVGSGILPAVQLANVFPYAVRAGTIAAVSTGAIGFIVGTVIVAAVTIALEIYRITENAKISHTLIENRTKAQQATPDLKAELAKTAGYQNLYTTFLRQTMPDVNYGCTGTATGANAPACANAPTPPAQNLATDARFIVGAYRNGVGDLQITPTIYTYDPLNWATGRLVRMSGNGWFVSTSYDLNDPSNVAGPAHPSVPDGGHALLHSQSLTIGFQDWDNRRWSARRIQDSQGREAFAVAPLDANAQGSCASAVLGTTKNNCITYHLNYREPDGTRAVTEAAPASAVVPAVSMQAPTVVRGTSTHQLSATATTQLGSGPYTYQWTVGSATYTGPSPQVTFPSGPGFVQVKVTATDAQGHQGTSITNVQVLAPVAVTVLTKSFDTVAGQPVTFVARVKNLGCPGEAFSGCTLPATGRVQFYVDGQPLGTPATLVSSCPSPACSSSTLDFNSSYALSESFDDLAPTSHPLLNATTGMQTGQIDGTGHAVTAQYLGDANFLGASGGLATVTGTPSVFGLRVRQAVPTVALDAPVYPGAGWDQPVTLHARVAPPAGLDAVPSGTIGFAVNGTRVGAPVTVDANGDATLTTTLKAPKPGAAPYQFTARYSGSVSFEQAEANQTVGPKAPRFGVVSEITSTRSPIVVPFTRPIMGVSKATFFVQRGDTGAKVLVKHTCTNAVNAPVKCAKGPVSAVSISPSTRWIPNMNYLVYIAYPATKAAGGYPDATAMQADGVMRRAPATVDAWGDAITYQWGIRKQTGALGGSYRQEQHPGASASFKATGTSIGIITWNGPDGGLANVKVTAANGAVVTRTIDTYAATAGDVTTTITGLPAGQHTVLITVPGAHSASSNGNWVRVDGTISNGKTARSPALTPAMWPNIAGSYAYTGSTKATLKFGFFGTSLDWTAFVGPNNGKVKVTIDGTVVAAAQDLYAPGFSYQTFHYGGLAAKAHTVVITNLGQRDASSTDTIATFRSFTAG